MHISCMAGRHQAQPGEVRNQGFAFSRCRRCGRDMIRSKRAWQVVPRGFRVVWRQKSPQQAEADPARFLFDLHSTGRALVPVRQRTGGDMLLAVSLVLPGLRWLVWSAGARVEAWRRRLSSPRTAEAPVIRLPGWLQPEGGSPAS